MYTIKGKAYNGQVVYLKDIDSASMCKYIRHAFTIAGVVEVSVEKKEG